MSTALVIDETAERTIDVPIVRGNKSGTPVLIPDNLTILEGTDEPEQGAPSFRIMTARDGDKRITWFRGSLAEIRAAKKLFMDLVKQGMVPHRVGPNGKASNEVMRRFDAKAEEILFLPMRAVVGG